MQNIVAQKSSSEKRETINSESKFCGSDTRQSSQLCVCSRRMQVFLKHYSCHPFRGSRQVDVDLIGSRALVGKQCFDRPWK